MKKIIAFFFIIWVSISIYSEDNESSVVFKFDYDESGNRISRLIAEASEFKDSTSITDPFEQENWEDFNDKDLCLSKINAKVYPNPVLEKINIVFDKEVVNLVHSAEVYDINGKLIKTVKIHKSESSVSFKEMPPSIYIIKLISSHQYLDFKIIKR